MKKVLALILAVVSVLSLSIVMVYAADDGIMPCWNNTNTTTTTLNINSSGKASIGLNCAGITGKTTQINAETKLERKWGLLWLDVDGAEWTDTTSSIMLSKTYTFQLSKTGTYRATTVYTVSGSGGSADEITCRAQDEY